jgi:hypothetical protein
MSITNVPINTATNPGPLVAVDQILGIAYQIPKFAFGVEGAVTLVSSSDPLPTTIIGSISPGFGALNLGKASNTLYAAADVGVGGWGVRNDADTSLADATGKYAPLQFDANGFLKVNIKAGAGAGGTSITDNTVFTRGTTAETPVGGIAESAAPSLTSGRAAALSLDLSGALRVNVTTGGIPGFADNAAFTVGSSQTLPVGFLIDDVATAVGTEGSAIIARATPDHKQLVQPYESPANYWNYAPPTAGLVSTTGVTVKASAGGSLRNYVTSVQVTNSHPTVGTEIRINDGAGGTALHRGFAAPLAGYTATFAVPLRGSAATLLEIAEVTATATTGVLVNLQGYIGA